MPTYIPIASLEISGATTATFSSIPQTYDDLLLSYSAKMSGGFWSSPLSMQINGDTNSIYNGIYVSASTGATGWSGQFATTSAYLNGAVTGTDATNVWSNSEIYFPDYTSSRRKTANFLSSVEGNTVLNGTTYNTFEGIYFATTNAITSLTFFYSSNSFTAPSTFYLYGIKNT